MSLCCQNITLFEDEVANAPQSTSLNAYDNVKSIVETYCSQQEEKRNATSRLPKWLDSKAE